jgi:SAM-dependent methyltransferase
MHDIAYEMGKWFFEFYCQGNNNKIVELGSFVGDEQIGMALRNHSEKFVEEGGVFIGIDIAAGRNVDVVYEIGKPLPIADNSADAVVTSSCFEHDLFFWESFLELCRITKDGGYIYISVPSGWNFHRHHYDCWRFYPDASVALKQWAQKKGYAIELMESFLFMERGELQRLGWSTFYAVFRKGAQTAERKGKLYEVYKDDVNNIHDIDFNDDNYVKDYVESITRTSGLIKDDEYKDKKIKEYKRRVQVLFVGLVVLVIGLIVALVF